MRAAVEAFLAAFEHTLGGAVDRLNREYAVAWAGGDVVILREHFDPNEGRDVVTFIKRDAMQEWFANDTIQVGDRVLNTYDVWRRSERRRKYDSVVFEPYPPTEPVRPTSEKYNLFRGWPVAPDASGSCALLLRHLHEVLCRGNDEHSRWLLAWLAQHIQSPANRPGTSVVLRGGEGVGKGIAVRYVGSLYGRHFVHLSDRERLTGRFNVLLKEALLVFADELLWGGDRKSRGLLNAIITEPTVIVEPKFKDSFAVRNHMSLIIATNERWVVPTEHDARRFLMLDVDDRRRGDTRYFAALDAEMQSGGPAALMHHLLNLQIDVNLRIVPQTAELAEQKRQSFNSVQSWWHDTLSYASLLNDDGRYFHHPGIGKARLARSEGNLPVSWRSSEIRPSRRALYAEYLTFCENTHARDRQAQKPFWNMLKEMCPRLRMPPNTNRFPTIAYRRIGEVADTVVVEDRYAVIPALDDARNAFEQWAGPTEWPSPDETG